MAGRNRPVTALNVGHGPLARLDAVQKISDVRTEQRVGCAFSARLSPQPPLAFSASLRAAGRMSPEHGDLIFRRHLLVSEHLVAAARKGQASLGAEELEALARASSQARFEDRAAIGDAR